jgi:hypothetical protein
VPPVDVEAESYPVCDGGGVAGERPSRPDQRGAAVNAGMRDVLKTVRRGAISVQRGCDGGHCGTTAARGRETQMTGSSNDRQNLQAEGLIP